MKNTRRAEGRPALRRGPGGPGRAIAIAAVTTLIAAAAVAAGSPAIIRMTRPADPEMPAAVFRHWKHQAAYKCYACHPGYFSETDKVAFDHDAMDAGKYCGACHNGEVAFRPADRECEVCHAE